MLEGVTVPERDALRHGDPAVAEHRLEEVLVHAERGGGDTRADVRETGELEKALYRPVLAERPVQDGEHDVDFGERRARCLVREDRKRLCDPLGFAQRGFACYRRAPSAHRARSRSASSRSAPDRGQRRPSAPTRRRSRARSSALPRERRLGRVTSRLRCRRLGGRRLRLLTREAADEEGDHRVRRRSRAADRIL